MGWLTSKWFYIFLVIAGIIAAYFIYQHSECQKKGKLLGGSWKCGFGSKTPVPILPLDEYYDLREGECFHYVDYGDRMAIKKVDIRKCD